MKGPSFIALHKLFDEINDEAEEYVDLLAERIVQVGGVAEGTARVVAERSALEVYPLVLKGADEHVEALSSALAAFGRTARLGIEEMNELQDADSADILTGISRGIDKWLWFVEAHQQSEASTTVPPAARPSSGRRDSARRLSGVLPSRVAEASTGMP